MLSKLTNCGWVLLWVCAVVRQTLSKAVIRGSPVFQLSKVRMGDFFHT